MAEVVGDRASGSDSTSGPSKDLPAPSAVVPLPDRVGLVTVPEMAIRNKPRLRVDEVWNALAEHYSPLEKSFAQIQYIRNDRFRVWCTSPEVLEELICVGVTIRGYPVTIRPYQSRSWVTITHLPYGLVEADIKEALTPYGKVHEVKFVYFRKVRTGTIKVRMDISTTIPTRLRVCGHAGLVFHQGQARTCFNCGALGHESKKCPKKRETTTAPTTTKDAPPPADTLKPKRKRKRRKPRSPPPDPGTGSSEKAQDPPPPKKIAPPSGGASSDDPPPPPNPTATSEQMDTTSVDTSSKQKQTTPPVAPHLLLEDSVEAASKAPPHQNLDEKFPRHATVPSFRRIDNNYLYVEEGELEDNPHESLRQKLKLRGQEIRKLIAEHGKKGVTYKIKDPVVMFFSGEKKILEVPLFQRRSIILRNYLKSLT